MDFTTPDSAGAPEPDTALQEFNGCHSPADGRFCSAPSSKAQRTHHVDRMRRAGALVRQSKQADRNPRVPTITRPGEVKPPRIVRPKKAGFWSKVRRALWLEHA